MLANKSACLRCTSSTSCRLGIHRPLAVCTGSSAAPVCRATQQAHELLEAQAAFNASLEKIVSATSNGASRPGGAEETSSEIGRLALLHSTQKRFSRTHMNTVDMSIEEDDDPASLCEQLPLSQLAFKVLLRASLAAARMNHSYVTTLHILLGLLSAEAASNTTTNSSSSSSSNAMLAGQGHLAPAADRYAEAEAAVRVMIDGPGGAAVSPAAAAASLLGQSCGLDVVTWCSELSSRAQGVLTAAEQLRKEHGHSLLTSSHLLAALLSEAATAPQPWVNKLLVQLGQDAAQMAQQLQLELQQQEREAVAAAAAAEEEDAVLCKPVGFLHEEFYQSLLRSVSPSTPVLATYSLN